MEKRGTFSGPLFPKTQMSGTIWNIQPYIHRDFFIGERTKIISWESFGREPLMAFVSFNSGRNTAQVMRRRYDGKPISVSSEHSLESFRTKSSTTLIPIYKKKKRSLNYLCETKVLLYFSSGSIFHLKLISSSVPISKLDWADTYDHVWSLHVFVLFSLVLGMSNRVLMPLF